MADSGNPGQLKEKGIFMESHSSAWIAVLLFLVVLSAFFSAAETAYSSLNRIKIKNLANDGKRLARRALRLAEESEKLFLTLMVANHASNLSATAIGTALLLSLYGDIGLPAGIAASIAAILIFGEITPRTLAREAPERTAMLLGPAVHFFLVLLTPVTMVFTGWRKAAAGLFKVSGHRTITEDELITMVEEAETEGGIDGEQSELIQNAIEFNELVAIDVLTPRVDMEAIGLDMGNDEIAGIFRKTGFSRLPVYQEDLDEILGVLNQKDFHNYIYGKDRPVSDFVKPVAFVAGSMKLSALLRKLQQMKSHIAIVVDEYGGTEGLVTMEDIIEELVGEIYDEHDVVLSQEVTELQNGSYRVICSANLDNVFDYFGIEEDVDANTVNGWVVLCLDKLPEKGDTFEYRAGGKLFKARVTKANGKKAIEINLSVTEEPVPEKPPGARNQS